MKAELQEDEEDRKWDMYSFIMGYGGWPKHWKKPEEEDEDSDYTLF